MEVKSVGTFPVILLKLATPRLSLRKKLNFEQSGWDDEMKPKPNKKLSLGAVLGPLPVILLKQVTPSVPSHPKQSWILRKMGGNQCIFLPQHCWGELGNDGMNPKPNKKMVIRSRLLRNNYLEGLFNTAPSSLSSIAVSHILGAL